MKEPNYEQLLADIYKVAREQPDKSFPKRAVNPAVMGCIYVYDDGSPCCIVGQAWARQEPLDTGWFAVHTGKWTTGPRNTKQFNTLISEEFDPKLLADQVLVQRIREIQDKQDNGLTWAEAIAE